MKNCYVCNNKSIYLEKINRITKYGSLLEENVYFCKDCDIVLISEYFFIFGKHLCYGLLNTRKNVVIYNCNMEFINKNNVWILYDNDLTSSNSIHFPSDSFSVKEKILHVKKYIDNLIFI